MTLRLRRAAVLALAALSVSVAQAQQPRLITEADLLKFVWMADPQVSPDGSQVAFVRVVVNEKTDDYDTNVWIAATDGRTPPRPLTSGMRDTTPRWAPDGKRLAFVRPLAGTSQVFVISTGLGEAVPVTDLPRGASGPSWSPDGQSLAFSSTTRPDDFEKKDPSAAPKSDVRVITSATYRSNGSGWNDPDRPAHIWVTTLGPLPVLAKAKALTSGKYAEGLQGWSTDGRQIYFTSTREDEPYFHQSKSELFAVPAVGGEFKKIASINGAISAVKPSPDGRMLAFVGVLNGASERSYDQPDLFVTIADGTGTPRNLTANYDYDINGSIGGDQSAPRGGRAAGPIWSADGKSILVVVGEEGNAPLVKFDATTGAEMRMVSGQQTVQSYLSSADGHTLVTILSNQTTIGELVVINPTLVETTAPLKVIVNPNADLFRMFQLSQPEKVIWTSFDGKKIDGWLMKPPNFDPSKKYPFILEIHGGPHSAYGNVFTHEFQLLAARGYVVLFPNPRGSSNYGQDFGNVIQYHYPGDDYKDLMAGVDEIVKRGYVDPAKLGVTGGSGGGLLTNWTVTQTTRFAAAVSQRDIADWYGFWFTADFTQYTPSWFRKAPWEDPADYAARSPITHVANVKTPMLFVLGDDDLRTPPADGGEMMFRALKYLKVPTVMVRFPGETHELSRSGKPSHRLERLRHIAGWFDRWLMGNKTLYPDVK